MRSRFNCPACRNALTLAAGGFKKPFFVYCAVGRCQSLAANEGEMAETEADAFAKLEKACEYEQIKQQKADYGE